MMKRVRHVVVVTGGGCGGGGGVEVGMQGGQGSDTLKLVLGPKQQNVVGWVMAMVEVVVVVVVVGWSTGNKMPDECVIGCIVDEDGGERRWLPLALDYRQID